MQYWIFSIQAGLDNIELSNLIEHADNVTPADGNLIWRKSKIYGNSYPPLWISPPTLFYSNVPVQINNNELRVSTSYTVTNTVLTDFTFEDWTLNPAYRRLVEDEKNTAVPANLSYFWSNIDNFPFAETMKKDVRAIYVYSNNKQRLYNEVANTPLRTNEIERARQNITDIDPLDQSLWSTLYPPGFDAVIEMDKIWTDWDYLNNTLTGLGINLSRTQYNRYLSAYSRG
jgi:hypothetical protein